MSFTVPVALADLATLFALAVSGLSLPATGQEPAPTPAPTPVPAAARAPKAVEAEVNVVATRLGTQQEASTVRTVTREEIRRLPARSVPEVLQLLPGVDVRRRGPEGVQADVGIRGAGHDGTLVLVDGEPVSDPQTNHHGLDLDLPLDAVERIEVLYGAASALYGADAVGGVVNIVTRGASLGRARAQVEGRWGHGTDSLDTGSARIATKLGDVVTVAVDGGRSESSGFADDTEFSVNTLRTTARADTGLGPVSLALGYGGRSFGAYSFYGTRAPWQQETTRTRTARLSASLTASGWTISPSAAVRAHADDFVLDRNAPALYENLHDTTRTTFRMEARHPLPGGAVSFGAEAGRDTISSTNLGSHGRNHEALFVELGRAFSLSAPETGGARAGLRWDRYDGFGSRFSPQLSAWVSPTGGVRVRVSAGTAFRVPTFTDLYYQDPQNHGNADLSPERAVNLEAGASAALGPLALDAAVFRRWGRDMIDYVRSDPSGPYQATNLREADFWGVEASVSVPFERLRGGPFTRLALQATYLFADLAKLSEQAGGATQGKYVLDPLHVKWDLIVAASLPFQIAAWGRLSYQARPSFADGVVLADGRLGRDLLEGNVLEAYVEGQNLGDVTYEEIPGVPLPGRRFLLGLHLTW